MLPPSQFIRPSFHLCHFSIAYIFQSIMFFMLFKTSYNRIIIELFEKYQTKSILHILEIYIKRCKQLKADTIIENGQTKRDEGSIKEIITLTEYGFCTWHLWGKAKFKRGMQKYHVKYRYPISTLYGYGMFLKYPSPMLHSLHHTLDMLGKALGVGVNIPKPISPNWS